MVKKTPDNEPANVAELEPLDVAEFDITAGVTELESVEELEQPAFRASDVLEPAKRYTHRDVQSLFGLDPQIMSERFGYVRHTANPPAFTGAALAAWLDGDKVPIVKTWESECILNAQTRAAETAAEDEARRRDAEAKRAADPATSILDKAVASIDAAKQGEWCIRDAWRHYTQLVVRLAAGTPQEGDVNSLAVLMHEELHLTREQVEADVARVRKLQDYRVEVTLRGEREEAARQATGKLNSLKQRHRQELAEVVRECNLASSYADQSRSAVDSIRSLVGGRQELFASIDPPVLLGE